MKALATDVVMAGYPNLDLLGLFVTDDSSVNSLHISNTIYLLVPYIKILL